MGEYTILMVVSDAGLNIVYSGYAMLIVGVFLHFWGRRLWSSVRRRQITCAPVSAPPDTPEKKG